MNPDLVEYEAQAKTRREAQLSEWAERKADGEPQPANEQEWNEFYLSPLVGMKIVKVETHVDSEDDDPRQLVWSRIYVKRGHEEYMLEISRDEEGNGPGFLFGLPLPLPVTA